MPVAKSIIELLKCSGIEYQIIKLPVAMDSQRAAQYLGEDSGNFIRIVGFKEGADVLVVAVPYPYMIDTKVLSDLIDDDCYVLANEQLASYYKGCSGNSYPPIPGAFNVHLIVDNSLLDLPEVILESGDPEVLIKLDKINANLLFQESESLCFGVSPNILYARKSKGETGDNLVDASFTPMRLKQRIDETFDLPAMPEIAQDIMRLRVDPGADATRLAKIVRRDPSLATQVISWASSPYYGYQGKVDSVETAIARVLGFELVMNLALGITIGKCLKVPMDGPLGVREFWKQAIYSACLAEKLCRAMPINQRPERGLIYLSGLLHNFGHLLLGHIFPPQFRLVNNAVEVNPQIAIEDIEYYILGVTHEEMGAWLMKNWHMPEELIVAVHRHHQEEFWSKNAVYSNIVLVTNRMLKRLNIGDSLVTDLPKSTLDLLSLKESDVEAAFEDIQSEAEALDIMAKQLVA